MVLKISELRTERLMSETTVAHPYMSNTAADTGPRCSRRWRVQRNELFEQIPADHA